jgi:ribosome maturation factor RimP
MIVPQAGRRRFRGLLKGFADGKVLLAADTPAADSDQAAVSLPFSEIAEAKLVLTDRLIADARNRRKFIGMLTDGSDWNGAAESTDDGDENG